MKLKDKQKLRQETETSLQAEVKKLEQEKIQKSLNTKIGKEKNLHGAKTTAHTIAIIKTILREKELTPKKPASTKTKPSEQKGK